MVFWSYRYVPATSSTVALLGQGEKWNKGVAVRTRILWKGPNVRMFVVRASGRRTRRRRTTARRVVDGVVYTGRATPLSQDHLRQMWQPANNTGRVVPPTTEEIEASNCQHGIVV